MKTLKHTINNVKVYLDRIQQFTERHKVPGVTHNKHLTQLSYPHYQLRQQSTRPKWLEAYSNKKGGGIFKKQYFTISLKVKKKKSQ